MIRIVVPLRPPTVNHYKVPVLRRGHISFVVTKEGKAFKAAVALLARGDSLVPPEMSASQVARLRYRLTVVVVLGKGQRGDGDNFWKCIADGLVDAGVIHSDAAVKVWHLEVNDREREDARTEIVAELMEGA